MSLTEEPYYMKRDCSPMCDHQQECSRCGTPKCIKYMRHSRLHGYAWSCGSQEWKPVMKFYSQGSGLTQHALDGQYLCARCGHPESSHPTAKCAGFARQ